MTGLHVMPAPGVQPALKTVGPPPILITEQQVAISTAAALGVKAKPNRWWRRATRATDRARRYGFLEDALLAREMDRL